MTSPSDGPISIDYETKLVSREDPVPPPVVLAIDYGGEQDLIHARDPACYRTIRELLELAAASKIKLSGFYVTFDLMVSAEHFDLKDQVFAALDANSIYCTMIRQKYIDIGHGEYRGYFGRNQQWVKYEYKLDHVAPRHGWPPMNKEDSWRLRYWELINTPLDQWPTDAIEYPINDVKADQFCWYAQEKYNQFFEDQFRRVDTSFCLAAVSRNGLGTSKFMVGKYREMVQARLDQHRDLLLEQKFIKPKADGKYKSEQKKMQLYAQAWCVYKGITMPETKTGMPSLAAESVKKYRNKLITAFAEFGSAKTAMDRVDELEAGCNGLRIHTRFDELAKSGRSTSSNPNIQNRSVAVGDRESIVADEGYVLGCADADGLELRTIAQSCIDTVGFSRLAEFLNSGEDPHLEVAAKLVGISYDEAKIRYAQDDPELIDARGAGKAKMVNFSSWAGTSVKGLNYHAQEVGLNHSMEESQAIYQAFLDSWPEATEYFRKVKSDTQGGVGTTGVIRSGRYAGLLSYTESCSYPSQGLGADATMEALRRLVRHSESYRQSILFGCPVINYIHDEFHQQFPDDEAAHDRAMEMGRVFREGMAIWLPDVPPRAKPYLTYRWSKMAKAVYDSNKRLIPWDFDMLGETDNRGRPWPADVEFVRQSVLLEDRRKHSWCDKLGNLVMKRVG